MAADIQFEHAKLTTRLTHETATKAYSIVVNNSTSEVIRTTNMKRVEEFEHNKTTRQLEELWTTLRKDVLSLVRSHDDAKAFKRLYWKIEDAVEVYNSTH